MPGRSAQRPRSRGTETAGPDPRVVAITGAHGFLGSHLIRHLDDDPQCRKILAIDLRKPEVPSAKTRFFRVDLTSPSADAEVAAALVNEGADTIVHAAFLSHPTHAEAWAHELEVIGTLRILDAAAEARVRKLVLWSLTSVYGVRRDNPNYLTEDSPLRPDPGDRAIADRAAADAEARRFAEEHRRTVVTILRTANVIGPTIRNHLTRLLRWPVVPCLLGRDPLVQLLHEEDFVDAFRLAVHRDVPGVFNVAADGVLPYSTVLALLGRVPLPLPEPLAFPLAQALWAAQLASVPPAFLETLRHICVADTTAARERLGFRPRFDIKAAILDFAGVAQEPSDAAGEGGRV